MTDPDNNHSEQNPVGRFMVAAGAVIEHANSGDILLIRRSPELDWQPNQWEICYGRIAQHESAQEGLTREIKEELELEIEIVKILRAWHMYRGNQTPENELIGLTFHARTNSRDVQLSKEHTHFQWVRPERALNLVEVEGIRQDILAFLGETPR